MKSSQTNPVDLLGIRKQPSWHFQIPEQAVWIPELIQSSSEEHWELMKGHQMKESAIFRPSPNITLATKMIIFKLKYQRKARVMPNTLE